MTFFHPTLANIAWREKAEKSSIRQLHPSRPTSRQLALIRFLIPVPGVQVSPGALLWRGFAALDRNRRSLTLDPMAAIYFPPSLAEG
jgi:hypothetical protein